MAYAGKTPWHGLGFSVAGDLTPQQMLEAAKLDWTVSRKELVIKDTGVEIPNKFALCRDSDGKLLSVVGSSYKPIQNDIAMDFFAKFVEAGDMTMETAGSLHGGKYIWGLARIGKDFALGGTRTGDEVRGYLLLMSPHVHGKAMVIALTPIRVVCWNTLNFALGSNLRGKDGQTFRMPHSMKFDDAMRGRAQLALGLATKQMVEFEQASKLLSNRKAKAIEVDLFFKELLNFDPEKARKLADGTQKEPVMLKRFREALTMAPGAHLRTAEGTWWGAVNAVTATIDHVEGKGRDTALASAWVGYTSVIKRKAFELALVKAR